MLHTLSDMRIPMFTVGLLVLSGLVLAHGNANALPLVWPTPNTAFAEGKPLESYIQPTASGIVDSGLFGCVRNDGRRFHEGIDLLSIQRDRSGESTDPVFAVMDGVVAYVNRTAGHSGYGRYVVLEHPRARPAVYTLYSHLRSIPSDIQPGVSVSAGDRIGVLGRSAGGYTIPRSRAHLHFEIGLRLSDDFQSWFDRQPFGEPNRHQAYSGLNLVGTDPLAFFTRFLAEGSADLERYFQEIPAEVTLVVNFPGTPDFVQRYPNLLTRTLPTDQIGGWEVGFTGYGLPIRWTPLSHDDPILPDSVGEVAVIRHSNTIPNRHACRDFVRLRDGQATLGRSATRILQLLFGFQ